MPGPLIYAVFTNGEAVKYSNGTNKWRQVPYICMICWVYTGMRQETAHNITCLYRGIFSKMTLPLFQQPPLAEEDGPERRGGILGTKVHHLCIGLFLEIAIMILSTWGNHQWGVVTVCTKVTLCGTASSEEYLHSQNSEVEKYFAYIKINRLCYLTLSPQYHGLHPITRFSVLSQNMPTFTNMLIVSFTVLLLQCFPVNRSYCKWYFSQVSIKEAVQCKGLENHFHGVCNTLNCLRMCRLTKATSYLWQACKGSKWFSGSVCGTANSEE